ncbi:transcription termination/antitermination protein NusG [Hyphobacterium marinum]|uniref:Transcription termination/antitermination protein NusG n=1 Tax=Hyphobacterium marinum TaxID=3116574 RepID=A0ABU7M3E2_9PROT|nr:transcription termination/antitermination protein NusG [Hyphobacterium sp. Y6023]MEE2567765.1 transcription termination/antitermination protein NusG [Hyphobacterium sp. Y6023]
MSAKWYIVHAYSNFEKKVAEAIKIEAVAQGLEENFEEILVPTEDVVEVRKGRKVNTERKYFPGYVLVKANLTDAAYHLVKNTPKVTGFLGSGNKPMPVSEIEVKRILGQIEEDAERPRPTVRYDVGETVRVIDGHFQSFNGVVEEVDEDNARLKVAINIFGRATPVELEYNQVEKSA